MGRGKVNCPLPPPHPSPTPTPNPVVYTKKWTYPGESIGNACDEWSCGNLASFLFVSCYFVEFSWNFSVTLRFGVPYDFLSSFPAPILFLSSANRRICVFWAEFDESRNRAANFPVLFPCSQERVGEKVEIEPWPHEPTVNLYKSGVPRLLANPRLPIAPPLRRAQQQRPSLTVIIGQLRV